MAEREQLPGEGDSLLGGFLDGSDGLGDCIIAAQRFESRISLQEDDAHEIAEIMSDAAGKPADALHLLGMRQLGLEALPFLFRALAGLDIRVSADDSQGPAPGIAVE